MHLWSEGFVWGTWHGFLSRFVSWVPPSCFVTLSAKCVFCGPWQRELLRSALCIIRPIRLLHSEACGNFEHSKVYRRRNNHIHLPKACQRYWKTAKYPLKETFLLEAAQITTFVLPRKRPRSWKSIKNKRAKDQGLSPATATIPDRPSP